MKNGQSRQQQVVDTREVRRLVLEGTFSVEEMDMATKRAPKTVGSKKKRTVRKKAAAKKAGGRKPAGKTARKKAGVSRKKPARTKSVTRKKVAKKKAAKKNVTAAGKRPAKKTPGRKTAGAGPIELIVDRQPSIREIAALKDQLDAAYAASSAVRIDAGGIESIDTAALQLLLAFENSLRKQSRVLEWSAQSDEFRRQARLAGLAEHFGSPAATAKKTVLADDGLLPVF